MNEFHFRVLMFAAGQVVCEHKILKAEEKTLDEIMGLHRAGALTREETRALLEDMWG